MNRICGSVLQDPGRFPGAVFFDFAAWWIRRISGHFQFFQNNRIDPDGMTRILKKGNRSVREFTVQYFTMGIGTRRVIPTKGSQRLALIKRFIYCQQFIDDLYLIES